MLLGLLSSSTSLFLGPDPSICSLFVSPLDTKVCVTIIFTEQFSESERVAIAWWNYIFFWYKLLDKVSISFFLTSFPHPHNHFTSASFQSAKHLLGTENYNQPAALIVNPKIFHILTAVRTQSYCLLYFLISWLPPPKLVITVSTFICRWKALVSEISSTYL